MRSVVHICLHKTELGLPNLLFWNIGMAPCPVIIWFKKKFDLSFLKFTLGNISYIILPLLSVFHLSRQSLKILTVTMLFTWYFEKADERYRKTTHEFVHFFVSFIYHNKTVVMVSRWKSTTILSTESKKPFFND